MNPNLVKETFAILLQVSGAAAHVFPVAGRVPAGVHCADAGDEGVVWAIWLAIMYRPLHNSASRSKRDDLSQNGIRSRA